MLTNSTVLRAGSLTNGPWGMSSWRLSALAELAGNPILNVGDALPQEAARPLVEVASGVALVQVEGVVRKGPPLFGGESTDLSAVADSIDAVARQPQLRGLILAIDSPGGGIQGVQHLADVVRRIGRRIPVRAWAEGAMLGAAYWVGCAVGRGNLFVGSETTRVGGIGMSAMHVDTSKAAERLGVAYTEIVAGRYKNATSGNVPLSNVGRDVLQQQVDQLYSVFVRDVARSRSYSADDVLASMADGREFMGVDAVRSGLVDGVVALEKLIADLRDRRGSTR